MGSSSRRLSSSRQIPDSCTAIKPSISRLFEDLADRYLVESPLPEWFLHLMEDAALDTDEVADEAPWVPKIGVQNRFVEPLARKQEQEPQSH